jgi:gallate decarboxylase subunit D
MTGRLKTFSVSESEGGFRVSARVVEMGDDLLVILYGGILHIGAVAMGQPRPSLSDPGAMSATSSVFTFLGHKEDVVAKSMADDLSGRLERKSVVVAGIHWDNLSATEISLVVSLCDRLRERVVRGVTRT